MFSKMQIERVLAIVLFTVTVASFSENAINTLHSTITWSTFENLSNSNWTINQREGNITVYSKPSNLDPTLIALDENFTGNVWGSDRRIRSHYIFYARSIPDLDKLADITLTIKYYLNSSNETAGVAVSPVKGNTGVYILPKSSSVEWNEVSLSINLESLELFQEIRILQNVGYIDNDDTLLFDEISLTFTERRKQFSCDGKSDGAYSRKGSIGSFWRCDGGYKTVHFCPLYYHFNPLRRECQDMRKVAKKNVS